MKTCRLFSKLMLSGLILSLILITTLSCSKEKFDAKQNTLDFYESIGKNHNAGLDYILTKLKQQYDSDCFTHGSESLLEIAENATIAFVDSVSEIKTINNDDLRVIMKSSIVEFSKNDEFESISSQVQTILYLTERQIKYLNKIDEILSETDPREDNCFSSLRNLELEIINNCSADELKILLTATSVCRNSLEYWNENLVNWIALLNTTSGKTTIKKDDWAWLGGTLRDMGKSDIVGGAIGAGVGALAGGVGAAPGAVAGACYASAGRGINSLLEHLGVW